MKWRGKKTLRKVSWKGNDCVGFPGNVQSLLERLLCLKTMQGGAHTQPKFERGKVAP